MKFIDKIYYINLKNKKQLIIIAIYNNNNV